MIGRRLDKIGEDGEHVTAFGRNETDQLVADRLGEMARRKIMGAS